MITQLTGEAARPCGVGLVSSSGQRPTIAASWTIVVPTGSASNLAAREHRHPLIAAMRASADAQRPDMPMREGVPDRSAWWRRNMLGGWRGLLSRRSCRMVKEQ